MQATQNYASETSFFAGLAKPVPLLGYFFEYEALPSQDGQPAVKKSFGGHFWDTIESLTAPGCGDPKTAAKVTEFIGSGISFFSDLPIGFTEAVDFGTLKNNLSVFKDLGKFFEAVSAWSSFASDGFDYFNLYAERGDKFNDCIRGFEPYVEGHHTLFEQGFDPNETYLLAAAAYAAKRVALLAGTFFQTVITAQKHIHPQFFKEVGATVYSWCGTIGLEMGGFSLGLAKDFCFLLFFLVEGINASAKVIDTWNRAESYKEFAVLLFTELKSIENLGKVVIIGIGIITMLNLVAIPAYVCSGIAVFIYFVSICAAKQNADIKQDFRR